MIKKFYKEILIDKKPFLVLDFEKFLQENKMLYIILTERGAQGKTFNALEIIRKKWLKNKTKALWLFNTIKQVDENYLKFLQANKRTYPFEWENWNSTRKGIYCKKELVCKYSSLSSASILKGTRDYSVKLIFYDEFNEKLERIKNKQAFLLESIIQSFSHPFNPKLRPKIFCFGNTKTLAIPLLSQLNIDSKNELIVGDVWLYYAPKKISNPLPTDKLVGLSKALGTFNQSFLNINEFDNFQGVIKKEFHFYYKQKKKNYFKIEKSFFLEWESEKGLFIEKIDEPKNAEIYTIQFTDNEIATIYNADGATNLANLFETEKIFFDSYHTKIEICSTIF